MECPKLNNLTINPQIVTIGDVDQPRLSSYIRTVGTTVTLVCSQSDWILQPSNPVLTCETTGQWNKAIPKCVQKAGVTEAPGLSEEQRMIIGITGGVGGVVFIILVVLICAVCRIQRKAKGRRKQERLPGPPITEVTSVGSLYALDKSYGQDQGYPRYPPSYRTRDNVADESLYAKRIALPPPSSGLNAYRNSAYLEDPDDNRFLQPMARDEFGYPVTRFRENPEDFISARSREIPLDVMAPQRSDNYRYPISTNREMTRDPTPGGYSGRSDARAGLDDVHYGSSPPKGRNEILEAIARERLDQLQHDRERFSNQDQSYNPMSRKNQRSTEAVVRAERTIQYVEEHSSDSPTLTHGESRTDTRLVGPRTQHLGSDLYSQVQRPFNYESGRRPGQGGDRRRPLTDYDHLGPVENLRGNPGYSKVPQEHRDNSRSMEQYTSHYDNARPVPPTQDQRPAGQPSRYASSALGHNMDQSHHWRPKTKTHFTGQRVR